MARSNDHGAVRDAGRPVIQGKGPRSRSDRVAVEAGEGGSGRPAREADLRGALKNPDAAAAAAAKPAPNPAQGAAPSGTPGGAPGERAGGATNAGQGSPAPRRNGERRAAFGRLRDIGTTSDEQLSEAVDVLRASPWSTAAPRPLRRARDWTSVHASSTAPRSSPGSRQDEVVLFMHQKLPSS